MLCGRTLSWSSNRIPSKPEKRRNRTEKKILFTLDPVVNWSECGYPCLHDWRTCIHPICTTPLLFLASCSLKERRHKCCLVKLDTTILEKSLCVISKNNNCNNSCCLLVISTFLISEKDVLVYSLQSTLVHGYVILLISLDKNCQSFHGHD